MSDFISRDALLKTLTATDKLMMFDGRLAQETGEWGIMMRRSDVIGTVMSEPSVDVAPVVRCRECIHHTRTKSRLGFVWCDKFGNIMLDDGFCSMGERRKDGGAKG